MNKACFTFDLNKCVGCHACLVACYNENETYASIPWREISTFNDQKYPDLPVFYYSLACNHCEAAPCMKNCPALAYSKDEKTGAIIHHPEKCMGCEYCTWACPYDAPKYIKNEGVVNKCTFCIDRLEDNQIPACANLCPTGALGYNNLEKNTELPEGFIQRGIGPAIQIKELRKKEPPHMDHSLFPKNHKKDILTSPSKIKAKHEWPLILFTLFVPFLVGAFWEISNGANLVANLTFSASEIIAAIFSMLHLGRKDRFWRSMLNIKGSWISREILFFSIFFGLTFMHLYIINDIRIAYIAMFFGSLTLLSIDKVYSITTKQHPVSLHSSMTLFTGALIIAIFTHFQNIALVLLISKMVLYIWRKLYFIRNNIQFNKILVIIRLLTLLISFLTILLNHYNIAICAIIIGEIIDRTEFYNEMDVITPQKELDFLAIKK